MLYGASGLHFRYNISQAFAKKFGIKVEVAAGGTNIAVKLKSEGKIGLSLADLFRGTQKAG